MPIEYYSPISGGAISTIIMQSAKELIASGHQVTVLTIVNSDQTYSVGRLVTIQAKSRNNLSFIQRRFSDFRRKVTGWDWPYYEYYLRSFMRELHTISPSPDVVVLFNDFISQKYIKRILPKAKVLVWLQNECRTHQKDMKGTVACTDRFLTCSAYIRDWTAKTYNIGQEKFAVVPSGVDLEAFFPRPNYLEEREVLRALFIGRIDPNKGPDIAADAVAVLQAEGIPISFSVAGGLWFYGHGNELSNPFFRMLKTKLDVVGAEYLGHVTREHVPSVIRDHDVTFVLSRNNEAFGLVVLEAMASGCAVISSNRGGLPEASGGKAMLVDPDNLDEVVDALRSFATDHNFLNVQKSRSLEYAKTATWAVSARLLVTALND